MARGHQAGCIEAAARYQLVGCVCLTKVPFQPLMKLQVQGRVRIVRLMCVLCGVLPCLHLPKKEGEKRGRRIEGRELENLSEGKCKNRNNEEKAVHRLRVPPIVYSSIRTDPFNV